jgi:hypothetical protein
VLRGLLGWCHGRDIDVVELHATPSGEPLYRSLGFAERRSLELRHDRRVAGGV